MKMKQVNLKFFDNIEILNIISRKHSMQYITLKKILYILKLIFRLCSIF